MSAMLTVNSPLRDYEFLGAVERIDQPVAPPLAPLAVGNVARLFRQHRHVRRQRLQPVHDDLVRLRIRERQRRLVRLVRHFELLTVDAENRVARLACERYYVGQQLRINSQKRLPRPAPAAARRRAAS